MKKELEEIGFNVVREYVHGDNDEFITQTFRKGNLKVDLDYQKSTGKLLHHDITIEETVLTLELSEINTLDKIINR